MKINSHVAVSGDGDRLRFGRMDRYNTLSLACGALHALLDGNPLPGLSDVVNAFESEGLDRLAIIRDPAQVDPAYRALYAAVLNARLQARHAILDVQDHHPVTPTKYIVAACVTLNRSTSDTELPCGYYTADRRTDHEAVHYRGLGDDPAQYRVSFNASRLRIEDEQLTIRRPARNHRQLVAEAWERHLNELAGGGPTSLVPAEDTPRATSTELTRQLAQIIKQAKSCIHGDPCHAKPMLLALLGALKVISPTPAAFILFAEGLGSIYHAHRLLRRHPEHQADARALLREIIRNADALTQERARQLIERLLSYYAPVLPR